MMVDGGLISEAIGGIVVITLRNPQRPADARPTLVFCDRPPLAYMSALRALARCAARTVVLLWRGQVHQPTARVGLTIRFADGTSAKVYRETAVGRGRAQEPCVLVVEFRLKAVRGRGHVLFRWESLLNTPLFVGFSGFVSKLWLANDQHGSYRGVYEWDGAESADRYARALWRVLALVCERGSIHYVVLRGPHRDEVVDAPRVLDAIPVEDKGAWWRLTAVS